MFSSRKLYTSVYNVITISATGYQDQNDVLLIITEKKNIRSILHFVTESFSGTSSILFLILEAMDTVPKSRYVLFVAMETTDTNPTVQKKNKTNKKWELNVREN